MKMKDTGGPVTGDLGNVILDDGINDKLLNEFLHLYLLKRIWWIYLCATEHIMQIH